MSAPIRHRQVFYIPGYDPMPPRRYRELYRSEGQDQAQISGYTISQTKGRDALSWDVQAETNGQTTSANIRVLYWADIVRASMQGGIFTTFVLMFKTPDFVGFSFS